MSKRVVIFVCAGIIGCGILLTTGQRLNYSEATECKIYTDKVILNTYSNAEINSSTAFYADRIEQRVKRFPETTIAKAGDPRVRVQLKHFSDTERTVWIHQDAPVRNGIWAEVDNECANAISDIAKYAYKY